MKKKTDLIYLLGAGRSGTTVFASVLGNHEDILNIGEMHQFYDHLSDNKSCSCGLSLHKCPLWSEVLVNVPQEITSEPKTLQLISDKLEYHSSIPKHFLGLHPLSLVKDYNKHQSSIFEAIKQNSNERYLLDSAKYIGRFLSLKRNSGLEIKGIYIVRDVRGVIHSFGKKVQSTRSPISAAFYYLAVNSVAEFTYWFNRKGVLKIRYEDLTSNPAATLNKVSKHLNLDFKKISKKIERNEHFNIDHIIGGNRLKQNKSFVVKSDDSWHDSIPRSKQIIFYFLVLPLMLINRYRP